MGIWKIEEPWQDMLALFQNNALYTDDLQKIQSPKRKCEWLAVRLLLKHLTGAEMLIGYRENGTPFIKNNSYRISISHTKGYAALILSKRPDPGIDIEYRSERAWKLRHRFMNATELEQFILFHPDYQPDPEMVIQQSTLAAICWCAKETAFKALQENEVDFISHFHIAPFAISDKGIIRLKETKTTKQKIFPIHYQVTDDFILTWKDCRDAM